MKLVGSTARGVGKTLRGGMRQNLVAVFLRGKSHPAESFLDWFATLNQNEKDAGACGPVEKAQNCNRKPKPR